MGGRRPDRRPGRRWLRPWPAGSGSPRRSRDTGGPRGRRPPLPASRRLPRSPTSAPPTAADRAAHTYGRSYRDTVRLLRGDLPHPPGPGGPPRRRGRRGAHSSTGAARPASPSSPSAAAPRWSAGSRPTWATAIAGRRLPRPDPPRPGGRDRPAQPGGPHPGRRPRARPRGPAPARTASPCATTPSRFEFSTLGGWLATRAGGHFATVYTHIDDLCESMRVVTPTGRHRVAAAARVGGRALARPAVPRVRGRPRRHHRGVDAPPGPPPVEGLGRGRVPRPGPRGRRGAGTGPVGAVPGQLPAARRRRGDAVGHPVPRRRGPAGARASSRPTTRWTWAMARALELCRDHGGTLPGRPPSHRRRRAGRRHSAARDTAGRDGAAGEWRNSFLRAPYTRDALVRLGVICETFETACTWDRFAELHAAVTAAVEDALRPDLRGRLGHLPVHPRLPRRRGPLLQRAGPRPPGRSELAQWAEIKAAASEALAGRRRHHHPPPRRRARPPALVRPPAAGRLRRRPGGRQDGARPGRHPQPGGPGRALTGPPEPPAPSRAP